MGDVSRGWESRLQSAWLSRGPLACLLLPVAAVFGLLTALRSGLYRVGALRTQRLSVPVVVVGNLVAGGAGKTPTVMAIVRLLREQGFNPGIISRGYGRVDARLVDVQPDTPAASCGDEPLLLRLRTGAPVLVGRDRVAVGQELLRLHPHVNIIVSDDGLQHWRLARQAQVLVFDERGVGNGWLLPAGPLRERLPPRVPPNTLVLYNASAPTTPLPGTLATRGLAGVVSLSAWGRGQPPPSQAALQALAASVRRAPVLAAAGLARPERFFDMLRAAGLSVVPLALPDHHDFNPLPWPAQTDDVVVTEKDAVKLDPARMGQTRVWVAALDFSTSASFNAALLALLPRPLAHPTENAHGSPTA